MTKEEINAIVLEEVDVFIYLVSMEDYQLLYMNQKEMEVLGLKSEEEWLHKPCYQVLYGYEAPCNNCPNRIVREKGHYEWTRYHEGLGSYLYQKYKLLKIDGKEVKLGITRDITEVREATEELQKQFQIESTLLRCVHTLYEKEDTVDAINEILSIIADYHHAERAYIFEFDSDNVHMNNTYEWCAKGITEQMEFLQNIEITVIDRWMERFEKQGEFYITSLSDEVDKASMEYEILEKQGIESLMAAPLRMGGKVVGFLGVDNPRRNTNTLLLMQSAAAFVVNDIQRRKNMEKLNVLSYHDRLTMAGNRHAYIRRIEELEQTETSLGIVFADINGMKQINDTYGHQRGDDTICAVAQVLKERFQDNIYRIGGDEFVVFCVGVEENVFEQSVAQLKESWNTGISVSVGALWIPECKDVEAQVAKTDHLMYQSKQKYYQKKENDRRKSIDNF